MSIYNLDNPSAQVVVLDRRNRMVEDFAQLLQTVFGLRSAGRGPLLARVVKQRGLRMKACMAGLNLGLGDSMRIRSVGSSAGCGVAAEAQRGEGQRSGGRGDSKVLFKRALSLLVVPSKAKAILDNFGRTPPPLSPSIFPLPYFITSAVWLFLLQFLLILV